MGTHEYSLSLGSLMVDAAQSSLLQLSTIENFLTSVHSSGIINYSSDEKLQGDIVGETLRQSFIQVNPSPIT